MAALQFQPRAVFARKAAIIASLAAVASDEDTRRHLMNRVAYNLALASGRLSV